MASKWDQLKQAADALRENLKEVDENIKKFTGRDPAQDNKPTTDFKRAPVKRNAQASNEELPAKRTGTEHDEKRWGEFAEASVNAGTKMLELNGGAIDDDKEDQPSIHSSVVVTGELLPVEKEAPRPKEVDRQVKSRNRRMFGHLVGTLKQFKKESQVKTETDIKREEKFAKVEEDMVQERKTAFIEKKALFQSRRDKEFELKEIEWKMDMEELKEALEDHHKNYDGFIRLNAKPYIFYLPAVHNDATKIRIGASKKAVKDDIRRRFEGLDDIPHELKNTWENRPRRNLAPRNDQTPGSAKPRSRDLFEEEAADEQKASSNKTSHNEKKARSGREYTRERSPVLVRARSPVLVRKSDNIKDKTDVKDSKTAKNQSDRSRKSSAVESSAIDDIDLKHDTSAFDFQDDCQDHFGVISEKKKKNNDLPTVSDMQVSKPQTVHSVTSANIAKETTESESFNNRTAHLTRTNAEMTSLEYAQSGETYTLDKEGKQKNDEHSMVSVYDSFGRDHVMTSVRDSNRSRNLETGSEDDERRYYEDETSVDREMKTKDGNKSSMLHLVDLTASLLAADAEVESTKPLQSPIVSEELS